MILFEKERIYPDDKFVYHVTYDIIKFTSEVLSQYGSKKHEGLVYWCGIRIEYNIFIKMLIAPHAFSYKRRIEISPESNVRVVRTLARYNFVQLGQVHSHPTKWIDHSEGDDEWTAFKSPGLISIVVPDYCQNGMLPLKSCGVHRYDNDEFIRLSDEYIEERFLLSNENSTQFIDLRK